MDDKKHKLNNPSILVIFAYAPTGFGHLRVTDALYRGLPPYVSPLLLGSRDESISVFYRLVSVNPFTRAVFEWFEHGFLEQITTPIYRWYLRSHTQILYQQFTTILDQHLVSPQTILIIATHFGLAHQIASLKDRISKERKIKILLIVQITDDIPHRIWYIPGADIIFVPSDLTRKKLESYGRNVGLPVVKFETNPYPTNPLLNIDLKKDELENKFSQLDFQKNSKIHMIVPISGAAVGTTPLTKFIDELYSLSNRFVFHVITKSAPYTQSFISEMTNRNFVKLTVSDIDKEVVNKYIDIYMNEIISLEVTKPSEQAFKALLNTDKRGSAILLFTAPIGQQEYDNLDFLMRHNLVPSKSQEKNLWNLAENNENVDIEQINKITDEAKGWRGISLPNDPKKAAKFVLWSLKIGLFSSMAQKKHFPSPGDPHGDELSPYGVEKFWQKVEAMI